MLDLSGFHCFRMGFVCYIRGTKSEEQTSRSAHKSFDLEPGNKTRMLT